MLQHESLIIWNANQSNKNGEKTITRYTHGYSINTLVSCSHVTKSDFHVMQETQSDEITYSTIKVPK